MQRPSHRAFPGPAASGPGELGGLFPPCCPASARLSVTSRRAPCRPPCWPLSHFSGFLFFRALITQGQNVPWLWTCSLSVSPAE